MGVSASESGNQKLMPSPGRQPVLRRSNSRPMPTMHGSCKPSWTLRKPVEGTSQTLCRCACCIGAVCCDPYHRLHTVESALQGTISICMTATYLGVPKPVSCSAKAQEALVKSSCCMGMADGDHSLFTCQQVSRGSLCLYSEYQRSHYVQMSDQ